MKHYPIGVTAVCINELCAKEYTRRRYNQRFCSPLCKQSEWQRTNRRHVRKLNRDWQAKKRLHRTFSEIERKASYQSRYRSENKEVLLQAGRDYWKAKGAKRRAARKRKRKE